MISFSNMVVIEPLMNMSERLIFLGRGLQNMSNVGPIENINIPDELIDMMNSIGGGISTRN